jgi:hypothetical protein
MEVTVLLDMLTKKLNWHFYVSEPVKVPDETIHHICLHHNVLSDTSMNVSFDTPVFFSS